MKDQPIAPGPLQELEEGFLEELSGLGYSPRTSETQLNLMRHLSRWLSTRGLTAGDLTDEIAAEFLVVRRELYSSLRSDRALTALFGHLRRRGLVPPALVVEPIAPAEVLSKRFGQFLTTERGLAPATVASYLSQVKPFLAAFADGDRLASLTERQVSAFVTDRAIGQRPKSLSVGVNALRSLLRWMWRERIVSASLADTTGSVAAPTGTSLPKALSAGQVKDLFGALSVDGNARLRDEAMLTSMLRLGLRSGEVAGLGLDDIDWRLGLIVVNGKGARRDQLPLPVDVGKLLVTYLKSGRPTEVSHRQVFLALDAPHRPLGSAAVTSVAARAMARAGISGPGAAHRLRHTAACQVLAGGGGLVEVGQLLRHSSPSATALYAKSDLAAMAMLARPWAGGSR
jgi:site-specific recombinase XerD